MPPEDRPQDDDPHAECKREIELLRKPMGCGHPGACVGLKPTIAAGNFYGGCLVCEEMREAVEAALVRFECLPSCTEEQGCDHLCPNVNPSGYIESLREDLDLAAKDQKRAVEAARRDRDVALHDCLDQMAAPKAGSVMERVSRLADLARLEEREACADLADAAVKALHEDNVLWRVAARIRDDIHARGSRD